MTILQMVFSTSNKFTLFCNVIMLDTEMEVFVSWSKVCIMLFVEKSSMLQTVFILCALICWILTLSTIYLLCTALGPPAITLSTCSDTKVEKMQQLISCLEYTRDNRGLHNCGSVCCALCHCGS